MGWQRRWLWRGAYLGVIGLLFALGAYFYIKLMARPYLYSQAAQVPETRMALVLGTSERTRSGEPNPWFEGRMDAAASLYKTRRCKVIIVSGDNRTAYYNEPEMMRRALAKRGVPASAVWMDYAGNRTLESVVRARQVFGQPKVIVVSQRFHLERAVYLARAVGVEAIGLEADNGPASSQWRLQIREIAARLLALWDLAGFRARHGA